MTGIGDVGYFWKLLEESLGREKTFVDRFRPWEGNLYQALVRKLLPDPVKLRVGPAHLFIGFLLRFYKFHAKYATLMRGHNQICVLWARMLYSY